jgi:hypothetical protein
LWRSLLNVLLTCGISTQLAISLDASARLAEQGSSLSLEWDAAQLDGAVESATCGCARRPRKRAITHGARSRRLAIDCAHLPVLERVHVTDVQHVPLRC